MVEKRKKYKVFFALRAIGNFRKFILVGIHGLPSVTDVPDSDFCVLGVRLKKICGGKLLHLVSNTYLSKDQFNLLMAHFKIKRPGRNFMVLVMNSWW